MWKLQERFVPPALFDTNKPFSGGTNELQREALRGRYRIPAGLSPEDCSIFFVGGESLALSNVLMTHGRSPVRWCHVPVPGS